jgi:hypothetical protein
MKNLYKLLFVLTLSLFIVSCGGDDDDDNPNADESFLVEYNGVIWAAPWNDSTESSWISFSPDGAFSSYFYDGVCESDNVVWGVEDANGDMATVQENTSDTLVILIQCISNCDDGVGGTIGDYTMTFTLSNNGNTLTNVDSDFPDAVDVWTRDDDGGC